MLADFILKGKTPALQNWDQGPKPVHSQKGNSGHFDTKKAVVNDLSIEIVNILLIHFKNLQICKDVEKESSYNMVFRSR